MTTRHSLRTALLAGTLLIGASLQGHAHKWAQWQNSLKPQGLPAQEIAVAVGGRTDYAIVIPASPTTQEQ